MCVYVEEECVLQGCDRLLLMRTAHTPKDLLSNDPKLETCSTSQPRFHTNVNMFSNSFEADADLQVRRSSVDLFHITHSGSKCCCKAGRRRLDSFIYVKFFLKQLVYS